jgi:predicted Zn-dependent peptidase
MIESVSLDDVRVLSEKVFNRDRMALTLLGPVDEGFSL